MLLRHQGMQRSSSGGTRGQMVCWVERCLCPEGLRLCFICWQGMQQSAPCRQCASDHLSRLRSSASTAALLQGDAKRWEEVHQD